MKKAKLPAVLTAVALAVALTLACVGMTACGATLESITLNTNGATTTFEVGDEFSAAGLKVTAKMSDGATQEVALKDCKISNPNMTVAGEKEITVTYREVKATYKITVKEKNVKPPIPWEADFEVDPATKTAYELSAMNAALDGSDRLGPSDVDPEISIGGMIVGDKILFMIDAKAAGKAKLSIDFDHSAHGGSPVSKLIKFAVNGAELATEADFNAGAEGHAHPDWKCYQKTLIGEVDLVKGQNTVTLEFLGNGSNLKGIILDFSDGTTPPVPQKTLESITADATAAKTDFYRDSRFLSDGVTVTATYSDDTTAPVTLADCTITAPDMSAAGEKTVKVAYGGKETTYDVTVKEYYNVEVTDTAKKFTLKAVDSILDDKIKLDLADDSVGSIAADDAPSMTYKFTATAAGKAKLLLNCDHELKNTPVSDCFTLTVGDTVKDLTGVALAAPAADHVHGASWHCFVETKLCEIDVAAGLNTVKFDYKANFTNVRGIALDFSEEEEPAPVEQTYKFEAEDALLTKCMTEYYATNTSISGGRLVGDMGTAGASAQFTVYADKAGTADLTVRYASSAPSVLGNVFDITVGTTKLDLSAVNAPAGSGETWYEWTTAVVEGVALAEGPNVITLARPEAGGGTNLDFIALTTDLVLTDKAEGEQTFTFDGTKATHSEDVGDEPGHEGWLNGIGNGSTVTFTFTSDKDTTGVLTFIMDHNNSTKPLVANLIDIEVNGVAYSSDAQLGYCKKDCPGSWHHAIPCKLGMIELQKDQPNTIKFTFKTGEGFAPSNFNGISIATTATLAVVTA